MMNIGAEIAIVNVSGIVGIETVAETMTETKKEIEIEHATEIETDEVTEVTEVTETKIAVRTGGVQPIQSAVYTRHGSRTHH